MVTWMGALRGKGQPKSLPLQCQVGLFPNTHLCGHGYTRNGAGEEQSIPRAAPEGSSMDFASWSGIWARCSGQQQTTPASTHGNGFC